MGLVGSTAVTQGPQGTVSSVVMEDERRILKSLQDIKDLLDRFNPRLTAKFSIKSLLTLVVQNTFSEMRSGATDMPLQLRLPVQQGNQGTFEEAMCYPICLVHCSQVILPTGFHHHTLH